MSNEMMRLSLEADKANIKAELHTLYGLRKKTRDKDVRVQLDWHERKLNTKLISIENKLATN